MTHQLPTGVSSNSLERYILGLADDELILGHRDSEWTGYAPILEEDIAFSNIAQDEIGHSLVWYTLYEELTGEAPDRMVFRRNWNDFTCCRFVEYPKGDFAYTVLRQYMFDIAEQIRLESFTEGSFEPLAQIADRLLKEEAYHRLHSETLLNRLGDATPESSQRMQAALDIAFPQALGMFEVIDCEKELVAENLVTGSDTLSERWLDIVVPAISSVSLKLPIKNEDGKLIPMCAPENGGRRGTHTSHLKSLVDDLQKVYSMAPEAKW
jgi:ring-1,2-phenylacetyl-CoA epoxidase subunit PaaC